MIIKKFILLLIALAGFVILAIGCSSSDTETSRGSDRQNTVLAVPVETEEITFGNITEEYYSLGTLKASKEQEVMSQVQGIVSKIYVNEGEIVKEGDILFTIDQSEVINNAESTKSQLEATLELKKIKMDEALANYEKLKALYEYGGISKTELDQAESSYNQAKIDYDKEVENYNFTINNLNLSISDFIVKSPIDGIIGVSNIEEGELIKSSATAFVIINTDPIKAEAQVTEEMVNKIYVDQDVRINITGNVFEGKVTSIGLFKDDSGNNTYPIGIVIENKSLSLKPGMFAEVYFILEKHEDTIVVPKKVIVSEDDKNYVFIVEEGIAKKIQVEKNIVNGDMVEIIGDLEKGDQLVVSGQTYLEDGIAVSTGESNTSNQRLEGGERGEVRNGK